MKPTTTIALATLSYAASAILLAPQARAEFVFELQEGRTLTADSYEEKGGKIVVFGKTGEVQVDRASVKSIRERSDEGLVGPGAKAPASPATSTSTEPAKPSTSVPISPTDLAAREKAVTRQVILAHRDLLFALNRGDDPKSIEKRRKEIDSLQKERKTLRDAMK